MRRRWRQLRYVGLATARPALDALPQLGGTFAPPPAPTLRPSTSEGLSSKARAALFNFERSQVSYKGADLWRDSSIGAAKAMERRVVLAHWHEAEGVRRRLVRQQEIAVRHLERQRKAALVARRKRAVARWGSVVSRLFDACMSGDRPIASTIFWAAAHLRGSKLKRLELQAAGGNSMRL